MAATSLVQRIVARAESLFTTHFPLFPLYWLTRKVVYKYRLLQQLVIPFLFGFTDLR